MSLTSSSLHPGRCYATAGKEVRRIVEFDGGYVIYVIGQSGIFPTWNRRRWHSMTQVEFAREATAEVPCERR